MTVRFPLATEKSIRLMESENKLVFMVHNDVTKAEIKEAIEKLLGAKVSAVNTVRTLRGKKAYVTFAPDVLAIDIATKLGLM